MTAATLQQYTARNLAQMAKEQGVPGWHSMRKDQLVRALLKKAQEKGSSRSPKRQATSSSQKSKRNSTTNSTSRRRKVEKSKRTPPKVQRKISRLQSVVKEAKDISHTVEHNANSEIRDRLIVMVRDPYWLHAYWELSPNSIARVKAALGQRWHAAKPVLRLFEVTGHGTSTPTETLLRTIEIHGGVSHWYIDLANPPKSYRLDIGYLSEDSTYSSIARSNVVTTPKPGARDSLDENWTDVAENCEKIFAMSGGYSQEGKSSELQEILEERLRRPMGSPVVTQYGAGASDLLDGGEEFNFEADAEMIIYGSTNPGSHISLSGDPVVLRPDGTFTMRMHMPDKRQVIPIVASSKDGVHERTIVLAIERNTKHMEAVVNDSTN